MFSVLKYFIHLLTCQSFIYPKYVQIFFVHTVVHVSVNMLLLCIFRLHVVPCKESQQLFPVSMTNFHPPAYLFSVYIPLSFSSVLHSLTCFCPLSNFLMIWPLCVSMSSSSSPCVAFSMISQGSVIFWRLCGWWVGQTHAQLSSMETRWMMIRGYVWLALPPPLVTN